MTNSTIFNWNQRTMMTADELRAGKMTPFDGKKHQRAFQRACFHALQAFRQARPQLAGQPVALFRSLAGVIEGLQAATFDLSNSAAEAAPARLEAAVKALIDAMPVKIDIPATHYERAKLLGVEIGKSNILLCIHNAEVQRDRDGNSFTRAIDACNALIGERDADPTKVVDLLNQIHWAAVELLLGKFAADVSEPLDEVAAAKMNAAAIHNLHQRAAAGQQ